MIAIFKVQTGHSIFKHAVRLSDGVTANFTYISNFKGVVRS